VASRLVTTADALPARIQAGDQGAIARLITLVERRDPVGLQLLSELNPGHRAHTIGVTGAPGSGKSTLVARIAEVYRRDGKTVGILAIDPSSSLTGGALLGDRIRMASLAGDPGVFIRSMASRGALGGLARASLDAVAVLEAAGMDVVILETVGVGQAEVDVVGATHTVAVVSVPGMGDDIQAIKAGLLEVADVHVVNKSDYRGAQRTVAQLRDMLRLRHRRSGQWNVPVAQTVAETGEGAADLVAEFARHRDWLERTGEIDSRDRRNASARIRWAAQDLLADQIRRRGAEFDDAVSRVAQRQLDPHSAAAAFIRTTGPSRARSGDLARSQARAEP